MLLSDLCDCAATRLTNYTCLVAGKPKQIPHAFLVFWRDFGACVVILMPPSFKSPLSFSSPFFLPFFTRGHYSSHKECDHVKVGGCPVSWLASHETCSELQ